MDWETFFLKYRDPDFVPGFTILNKLGSGVFGDVYKARRTSIGKIYAIKFLRIQDEHLQEQVLRELGSVENFAHVDHPNLVSIEDRGEVCGIPFIVMGYAGDETLKTLLGDGPLEPSRVVRLMRQILRGVEALHTHGIVHFDLKPANVFIKGDAARVGDYGLSRIMTESRATLSMGRGTPYYMAPEMLQRKGDARSDVYSLGVMLFEMLVGDVPFKGGTEWEILRRHEKESPVIPEEVPPGFREVLERSLQKNPERRFADAGEMLRALPEAPASGDSDPGARTLSFASSDRASSAGARAGRMVGRAVAQLPLSLARVREEVGDLLQQVRRSTGEMVAAARDEFDACKGQGLEAEHRAWWNPGAAARRAAHEARRARHMARGFTRPAGALFRGVGMLASGIWGMVAWPLFLAGWLAHNLVQVVVVLVIIAALCAGVHLGLEAAIL